MDGATAAGGKTYYLSVTPQCPYPDIYTNDILAGIDLDYVMVQFYNNVCGVSSFVPGASVGQPTVQASNLRRSIG
jgi:chitinase